MPMHKRILCVLLTVLMLLSLIPAFALPSRAASNMKLSEECVEILKDMEGFLPYPIYDHGHYSVGYGSSCDKDDYPNGITEEEADALMRQFLATMEEELNKFANRQGILFSQNQFDALMLFIYNCGSGWLYGNGEFRQAVLENEVGNTFIYYMTQWSSASSQLHMGLVTRRLIEADMYLNGSYTNKKPSNYTYVLYDNNGGEGKSKVQGFDCDLPAFVKAVPTREGYRFLGWYTAADKGNWITELSSMNAEQTLYAHWQPNDATSASAAAASYQLPSDQLVSRDFYNAPNGTVAGTLNGDAIASVKAEYLDNKGVKWGKLSNGCWVKLGDPRIGTCDESEPEVGVKVKVTGDYVNVRTGPGTQYKVIAGVLQGDEIIITQTVDVKGVLWGKFRAGWLCLEYTNYSGGLTAGKPEDHYPGEGGGNGSTTVIATGRVNVAILNIRATAGTHGYLKGCYKQGDKVEILEKVSVGGAPWGRTDKGWICLSFVKLDDDKQEPETSAPTTPPETTGPATPPETTVPPEIGSQTPGAGSAQGIPATVISKSGLNIRSGAGTNFSSVGSYPTGQKISILEQKTVGGVTWGRTDKGWVSMQYVRLDDKWTNTSGISGVVTSNGGLNIRSGPGVGYAPVGNYSAGQRIMVFEQTVAGGKKWGRTDKGWVCMDYVRLEQSVTAPGGTGETPEQGTQPPAGSEQKPVAVTGTITASGLNIRSVAGTHGTIVGHYSRGDKVTILEQKLVSGTVWGRTDKGWISLAYVFLDNPGAAPGSPRTGVITASSLCIRKGAGTAHPVVGFYVQGDKVTVMEIANVGGVVWGRTDKGWICMTYVK